MGVIQDRLSALEFERHFETELEGHFTIKSFGCLLSLCSASEVNADGDTVCAFQRRSVNLPVVVSGMKLRPWCPV